MNSIRKLREEKGITQVQLATEMNMTQAAVAMWESGVSKPRADKLPKIAEILGCSIADLF